MASPPFFDDLGSSAKDLFEQDFDFSKVSVTLKNAKSESGKSRDFEISGTYNGEEKTSSGTMSFKSECPKKCLSTFGKLNTESGITKGASLKPCAVKGLQFSHEYTFHPASGFKSIELKTSYQRENFNIEGGIQGNPNTLFNLRPTFTASSVFRYNGFYSGYQSGYDTFEAKVTANNFCLGYKGEDFNVNVKVADVNNCTTSVHHKLSDSLEVGICSSYNTQTSATCLGVVGKYTLGSGAVFKAKVNNEGKIGTSYSRSLRPGVDFSLCSLVDAKNFNCGGHKVGAAFSFDF